MFDNKKQFFVFKNRKHDIFLNIFYLFFGYFSRTILKTIII